MGILIPFQDHGIRMEIKVDLLTKNAFRRDNTDTAIKEIFEKYTQRHVFAWKPTYIHFPHTITFILHRSKKQVID